MIFFLSEVYVNLLLFIYFVRSLALQGLQKSNTKTHYDHNYSTISYSCLVNMSALCENENSLCLDCYNVTIKMLMTTA